MKFIVYKKPSSKNYAIAKVENESDKVFVIDRYSDSNFISVDYSVKKEYVMWETDNEMSANQVRNALLIAHRNRKEMIELAESGYKSHITSVIIIMEGKIYD